MSTGLSLSARHELGSIALDLSLAVDPGARLALVGPSGAGKTSALRVAAGLLRPDAGEVVCAGHHWLDTQAGIDLAPERRSCGYLFQDFALFPRMSALANVTYPLRSGSRRARRVRAGALLDRFGVGALADRRPAGLSGGERQRVALARVLARTPELLLLDEPLSALDARSRAAASRELRAVIAELGVPTIVVTHDFVEAAQLADRIAVIEAGRIVQEGTAAELAARPASTFVADLAGANVLSGTSHGGGTIVLDGGALIVSTDEAPVGLVTATVFPWEIALELEGFAQSGSQMNNLPARVESIAPVGGRVRVGLSAGQPLTAEVSPASVERLGLTPGAPVVATWKATATRVLGRPSETSG